MHKIIYGDLENVKPGMLFDDGYIGIWLLIANRALLFIIALGLHYNRFFQAVCFSRYEMKQTDLLC